MAVTQRPDAVKILVVDDQPSKLLTYDAILSELGEELIRANSASEALEALLKHEIAVVLADVCMPDLDGYELAAMIRQHPRCQRTSIIFVSAVMMTEPDRLRGYESGAVDYVPVPVVPEILRAKVGIFAELYRKTRALEQLNAELERRVAERTAALEATTAALREADRRKDEFLAMLAHELRNPLAPIRTAVQLLRLKELPEAHSARARDTIDRQVEHLVCLIDDLLDVSRITRGKIDLRREPVDLHLVVERAIEQTRPLFERHRQPVVADLPNRRVTVLGDDVRLSQVLGNLLVNAAKFTPPEGAVRVRLSCSGSHAELEVRDSGCGIAPDLLPHVFDLFVQGRQTIDRSHGGLGLGLAIVRNLVALHGGSVQAHSGGEGRGAAFTVRLPLHEGEQSRPAPPEPLGGTAGSGRILLVDDNADAAQTLGELLGVIGYEVRTAGDADEALEVQDVFRPQLALLDIGLPRIDGYQLAGLIRRRPHAQAMRLVALTGYGQDSDRARAREAGFDEHLVKPVEIDKLIAVIDRLLR
jgi:signal transduction histidine kinase